MINSHTTYTNTFRALAETHVDIRHSAQEMHFARIVLNRDPYVPSHFQIKEFISSIRDKMCTPFMLLVSYSAGCIDSKSDNKQKVIQGSFLILDKVETDDFDGEEAVYSFTEGIGDEILANLGSYYEENPQDGYFMWSDYENDKVAKVTESNFFGTRFNFSIVANTSQTFEYNPSKFIQE